ncbi:hypothetical protein ACVGOW_09135 [Pseudonocardia saturnea]
MGSNSRYDRPAMVTAYEADVARALHIIADVLDDYPGIDAPIIASRLGQILRSTAIELNAGRDIPIEMRQAVRHLAGAVRVEMQFPA